MRRRLEDGISIRIAKRLLGMTSGKRCFYVNIDFSVRKLIGRKNTILVKSSCGFLQNMK